MTTSPIEEEYWERVASGSLSVMACNECDAYSHPPRLRCPTCYSDDWEFHPIDGSGQVHAYTIVRKPSSADYAEELPVVSAIIELSEGPKLMTKVDCNPAEISIGDGVQLDASNLSEDDVRLIFQLVK